MDPNMRQPLAKTWDLEVIQVNFAAKGFLRGIIAGLKKYWTSFLFYMEKSTGTCKSADVLVTMRQGNKLEIHGMDTLDHNSGIHIRIYSGRPLMI